jgi:anthranilate synthase component 1
MPAAAPSTPVRHRATDDLAAFRRRARAGGLVPAWRHALLDTDTPVSAFAKLRRGPFAFLLESAPAGSETWSRYTFLGTEPRGAWRLVEGTVEEWTPEAGWHAARRPADPLADLEGVLARHRPVAVPGLEGPWSGAVGYLSYDVVRHIERLPTAPPRGTAAPDALLVLPSVTVVLDNLKGEATLIAGVPVPAGADDATIDGLWEHAQARLDDALGRLRAPRPLPALVLDPAAPPATGTSGISREQFEAGVARIKEYILAGDCFQALLARRIRVPLDFAPQDLYRALRAINPSPYMYHLVLDGTELVGSSPELLVRVADGGVTVRPIAGTRPRGATPAEDAALAAELAADAKERAEHVMLVDLGRNDVGRVARYGTVAVRDFMTVEAYSHVFHLVSEVTGTLRDGVGAMDVFRASFPAGTMTGAPKVRAMEIIDELEPETRGPYAGAVGWIGAAGDRMDLAITIRTCVISDDEAHVQAGAGIVADSVPALEWEETENKARAMLTAIGRVRAAGAAR